MNDTSPNTSRIAFVSALFGILALIVAKWGLSFGFFGALVIGLIVAAIVWAILWMGWKAPAASVSAPSTATATPAQAAPVATEPAAAEITKTAPASATPAAVATAPVATAMPIVKPVEAPAPIAKPAAAKTAAKTAAKPAAAKTTKPATAKAAKPAATTKKAAGEKPVVLAKARDGGPDDLKMIKGVGPVLEKALHASGVFHFDQVAAWKKADATWFDDNVKGANGRVLRDEWVKQAKVLAKGGTTAFSKKVKKGGVY